MGHKLLVWQHRKAPRDLHDLGALMEHCTVDDFDVDIELADAMAGGHVQVHEVGLWRAARSWRANDQFSAACERALVELAGDALVHRLADAGGRTAALRMVSVANHALRAG